MSDMVMTLRMNKMSTGNRLDGTDLWVTNELKLFMQKHDITKHSMIITTATKCSE